MAFLERNLEQLTVVQRQLVEQNSQLKKEAAIAERKLATRTERIRNLEGLLHDSQEKLTAASHRFVYPFLKFTVVRSPESEASEGSEESVEIDASADRLLRMRKKRSSNLRELHERFPKEEAMAAMRLFLTPKQEEQEWLYKPHTSEELGEGEGEDEGRWTHIPQPPTRNFSRPFSLTDFPTQTSTSPPSTPTNQLTHSRFELQLQSVKERLEAAKAGSTRGLGIGGPGGAGGFNFGVGPRIAKPLRGGGGGAETTQQHQTLAGLQAEQGQGNKRSSWFFNQRA
jgi:hypothetical protein